MPLPAEPQASFEQESLDSSVVFQNCLGGNVAQVRRFLETGGWPDIVYKSAYGWEVGASYADTKPEDGHTLLNYVATWTDIIGMGPSCEIVQLLLGSTPPADVRRDDGQENWFLPLHNAVANGAAPLVDVLLEHAPDTVLLTTGDGRTPLHVLSLCDEAGDREETLEVLLKPRQKADGSGLAERASVGAFEPFYGNTPLHIAAKNGHKEVVVRMLMEPGSAHTATNYAGRTALDEAQFELARLETESQPATTMLRSRLVDTIDTMQIAMIAAD